VVTARPQRLVRGASNGALPCTSSVLFHNWARTNKQHFRIFSQSLQGTRALQYRCGDNCGIGPNKCLNEPDPDYTTQTAGHGQDAINKKVSGTFRIDGAQKDASKQTYRADTKHVHTADTKGADIHGTNTKGASTRHT
jgi:hypothetical protein